jgi:hypothetical protein
VDGLFDHFLFITRGKSRVKTFKDFIIWLFIWSRIKKAKSEDKKCHEREQGKELEERFFFPVFFSLFVFFSMLPDNI